MARFLMAWEIGDNYGHVLPLLPVARALRSAGHEVSFALKDLRQAGPLVAAEGFCVIQAPAHPGVPVSRTGPQPRSMADILRLFGFDRPDVLRVYLQAWRELMQLSKADLVVASYAPVSLLAARTLGLPTALLGMAFELPPPVVPSPSFRPGSHAATTESDDAVVRGVNAALQPHGQSIDAVHNIFDAQRQLLWTFPELDPHAAVRSEGETSGPTYCGAVFTPSAGDQAHWTARHGPRIFGYLRMPRRQLTGLVSALKGVEAAFYLVVPGVDVLSIEQLATPNVQLCNQPVQLNDALSMSDMLLSYGGHGTVCAALLAGRPMVLLPEHAEGASIARCVASLGAAIVANPHSPQGVADACRLVLASTAYRKAAQRFQKRYAGFDPVRQASRVARVLHDLTSSPSAAPSQ